MGLLDISYPQIEYVSTKDVIIWKVRSVLTKTSYFAILTSHFQYLFLARANIDEPVTGAPIGCLHLGHEIPVAFSDVGCR